jgi:hypothetical protein
MIFRRSVFSAPWTDSADRLAEAAAPTPAVRKNLRRVTSLLIIFLLIASSTVSLRLGDPIQRGAPLRDVLTDGNLIATPHQRAKTD